MVDNLTAAFELADDLRSRARSSKAAGSPSMLVGNMGFDAGYSKLTRAKEQYNHYSGWVYTGVKAVAQRVAGQSICIGRMLSRPASRKLVLPRNFKSVADYVEPLPRHELLNALNDPNPLMTAWPLMFSTVASLLLTGRSHWWLDNSGNKLQLWPIPVHWLRPSDPLRGSWFMRPDGATDEIELPNEAVATFCLPDPSSPFGCVSPLQTQALAVATDESIQTAQYQSFRNGIVPQFLIRAGTLPGMTAGEPGQRPVLSAEQRIELVESIKMLYAGVAKRHEPLIVDGLIESLEKISTTPAEMDYMQSGNQTKSRILQMLAVNPSILGELQDSNRASATVAEQSFCNNAVNPIVENLSQSLTQWVARRYGENLLCWIDPATFDDRELTLQEWRVARQNGDVTCNEFRTQILGLPPIDGGDVRTDELGNPIESRSTVPGFSRNGHSRN